jgi:AcrR family transcriptional regulator
MPCEAAHVGPARELPIVGHPATGRADAARNRRRILAAAEELVTTGGVQGLTMNGVAAATGVGVGTVYRHFGDLAGLVEAMMDERERQLQQEFMTGPPPLGPDAAPLERIAAFLHAYVDLLDAYAPLMAVAEATARPSDRYGEGAYALHHTHLVTLIAQARPDCDALYLADALLAAVAAGLFTYQRHNRGMDVGRIKNGLDDLLTGLR